jgi:hypothetical protein
MDLMDSQGILTDIPTLHHLNPCKQCLSILKYEVNRVTPVGIVGDEHSVSERDGEAFVASSQWQSMKSGAIKKGKR